MSEPLCRVSIHCADESRSATADLVLPNAMAVEELMPVMLDVLGVTGIVDAGAGWQLARAAGPVLSPSMTLGQQGVRDGELLLLSAVQFDAPAMVFDDDCAAVIATADNSGRPPRVLGPAVCIWCVAVGALLLAVRDAGHHHLVPAALLLIAVAAFTVVTARTRPDPMIVTTLNCTTAIMAATVGMLEYPAIRVRPTYCSRRRQRSHRRCCCCG